MTPRPPQSDPRLIRQVLEYAADHSANATAIKFGTNHHNIKRWSDYRAQHGATWPTNQDVADWDAAQPRRAKMRAQQYRHAVRKHLKGGQPLMVPSHGTIRRIQALCAIGWSCGEIGSRIGVSKSRVSKLINATRTGVLVDTARVISDLYDELWDVIPVGHTANRVRTESARKGWVSPLAWDDDTIDDPAAKPVGLPRYGDEPGIYDESRILARMAGDRTAKTRGAENVEVVRRLLSEGRSQAWIAQHTGLKPERYISRTDLRRAA